MTSPRVGGAGLHPETNVCLRALALVVALASVGVPCRAQDSAVTAPTSRDTSVAARADSVRPDSAGRAPADTAPAPAPPPPVDRAIGAACKRSGGSDPDLLLVTFRATATAEDRAAVAEEIGGTLVSASEYSAPGAWYLRVPGSATDRSVADRLIMMSPVQEVGATRCPS